MFVSFDVAATAGVAPLTITLPNSTAIYNAWPPKDLRVSLPKYQRVATLVPSNTVGGAAERRLMSPPIHVRDGDFLSFKVTNSLMATGLSIHWHGFEMTDHLELDGVVGITQCPISPGDSFTYAWEIKETPGTYWYHTHSGELGIDAYNGIMGPLIVHPRLLPEEEGTPSSDIPFLDRAEDPQEQEKMSIDDLLFYGNERILFFGDGFLHSGSHHLLEMMGGLNPPLSYNGDKFSVGTYPWNFGTANGKLREVVPASPGQTLKFRVLNAGTMYALRISFDGYKMTVVAADSEPVEPVTTDEVILHAAERFDVMVEIPEDAKVGSTSWIRADTLESQKQGYQNGIRAILHIVEPNDPPVPSVDVPDPSEHIGTTADHNSRLTYNCYSDIETEEASGQGGCIPISALQLKGGGETHGAVAAAKAANAPVESHVIDWQFSPSPQFAHFVRIDEGKWYQFQMFAGHSMLLPEYDAEEMLHPNGAMLNVDAGVGAIIIWRNKSSMDHPIHLHGRKMEILEEYVAKKELHCDLTKCALTDVFSSDEKIQELSSIAFGERPLKDTFILPAGGAVATRFFSGDPALWFAHCHLEAHREDGMALILNVGKYAAPASSSWLPPDYPKCDTPFLLSKKDHPACDCYINEDAVMEGSLTEEHRCSRDFLCFHKNSPQSNLKYAPYESEGLASRSRYEMAGWAISLIIAAIVVLSSVLIVYRKSLTEAWRDKRRNSSNIKIKTEETSIDSSDSVNPKKEKLAIDTGVGVDEIGAAILLVNFQNEFAKGGKLYELTETEMKKNDTLSKTADLVSFARETGALIIHAPTILDEGDDSDTSKYSSAEGLFKIETWNSEEIISPLVDDLVIPHKEYDAFGPQLKRLLKEKKIKSLFVCGFMLEIGVHETIMSASSELEDADVIVVEDCCVSKASTSQLSREKTTRSINITAQCVDAATSMQMIGEYTDVDSTTKTECKHNRSSAFIINTTRTLPTTMDLPRSNTRRTARRTGLAAQARTSRLSTLISGSLLGGGGGDANDGAEFLPVAATDFTVPQRRSVIDFEVEGFNVRGSVVIEEKRTDGNMDERSPFMEQFSFFARSQWVIYRPTCISLLRVAEVTSLAFFTGVLFYDVANNTTATGFGSINSLLFFSVTLWTFTRMYPAINTYYDWNKKLEIISAEHRFALAPACLARCVVVLLAESGWPFLYVFVCYPLASLAGSWNAMFRVALMLFLNNSCYIALGACLGVTVPKIPQGMICSTIVAQASIVAAGFYTEVPSFLAWLRYVSPIFWTYRGIVKSSFHWSDTFKCRWGSTLAGVNSCFIEFHTAINNLKERGINVATFGDDGSTKIWFECTVLALFYFAMQAYICGLILWRQSREDWFEVYFERLCEYNAIHGNTTVPADVVIGGNIQLGSWVQSLKERKKKLTEEQIERLDELGFVW